MKTPFNLEAAKAGAKVITRDGRAVRIGIWDAIGCFPLVGAIEDELCGSYARSWTCSGITYIDCTDDDDLFMAPMELYICVSVDPISKHPFKYDAGYAYTTREEAEGHLHSDMRLMKLVEIESDPE